MSRIDNDGDGTAIATRREQSTALSMRGPLGDVNVVKTILSECEDRIVSVMPKTSLMRFERFMRLALLAVSRNPKLLNCTKASFLGAVMDAANLGFDPSGGVLGEAALVPYADECKLMPMYRGLINLARRSGATLDIWADIVYQDDEFDEIKGSEHKIVHRSNYDADRSDGKIIFAYMCANLGSGIIHPHVVDRKYIEKCRSTSRTAGRDDSPWKVWFPEMCKKTAIRQGIKMLPISSEDVARALELSDQEFESAPDQEAPRPKGTAAVLARIQNQDRQIEGFSAPKEPASPAPESQPGAEAAPAKRTRRTKAEMESAATKVTVALAGQTKDAPIDPNFEQELSNTGASGDGARESPTPPKLSGTAAEAHSEPAKISDDAIEFCSGPWREFVNRLWALASEVSPELSRLEFENGITKNARIWPKATDGTHSVPVDKRALIVEAVKAKRMNYKTGVIETAKEMT